MIERKRGPVYYFERKGKRGKHGGILL